MKTILVALSALLLLSYCSRLADDAVVNNQDKCRLCHELPPADRVHSAHVDRAGYDCGLCHPGTLRHSDGTVAQSLPDHNNGRLDVKIESRFDPKASAVYSEADKSCKNVYCHGGFAGGTGGMVAVTDTFTRSQCASCHDLAGMQAKGHLPHLPEMGITGYLSLVSNCDLCHTGYSVTEGKVNALTHLNGVTDPVDNALCAPCHTLPATHATGHSECTRCHALADSR